MMVAKVRSRSSDKAGLASSFDRASLGTSQRREAGEAYPTPPVKHLYMGDPRGLEGLIYEFIITWGSLQRGLL